MVSMIYLPCAGEAKQTVYAVKVYTEITIEQAKQIQDYLVESDCRGVIGIVSDNMGNHNQMFVLCSALNDAKIARNMLSLQYPVDYPEETGLPTDLLDVVAQTDYTSVHSADALVNLLDYYIYPDSPAAKAYDAIERHIKEAMARQNIDKLMKVLKQKEATLND